MNLLNKRFPSDRYPSMIIHLYYLMISFTFCYLYYHKFIVRADFHNPLSSGGLYAVLNFEAIKPIQYRVLMPFLLKALSFISFIHEKALFFLITIVLTYFILLSFYFVLNRYFQSKAHNCWLSPLIIYPMVWNYVIMNGQFFFTDFSALLIIILGIYLIISESYGLLLVVFFLGTLNHPSVGYLGISFLLFNYRRLFQKKTVLPALAMAVIYIGTYKLMDMIFVSDKGYFVIFNLFRNIEIFSVLPTHLIVRDLLFNFGGLHVFAVILFITGLWKKYRGPLLYINLTIVPYFFSVIIMFSIEEIRNYIAIIPFILIPSLIYLSTFENSFLKPVPELKTSGAD